MSHAAVLGSAVRELASSLELGKCELGATPEAGVAEARCGCVPIVGERLALQVVIAAGSGALTTLARRFLQLDAGETLSEQDLADAVCELTNMFAGRVKAQLLREDRTIRLGLPLFVEGAVSHGHGLVSRLDARIGGAALSFSMFEQG